ncbi:Pycsar system effector family protein [Streptomyces sp. NPDC052676]|uniref:Pycsar system effector family protein n=1 Tax=Streptomyces sp. NPDC052676 TaxID=3154953 RepID=UPI0034279B8E
MSEEPPVTRQEAAKNAWQLQSTLAELTRTADAKASFALAIESAALASLALLANSRRGPGTVSGALPETALWTGLALLGLSAVLAVLAVLPRHGRHGGRRPTRPEDFVFYGHIRHLTPAELTDHLTRHDPLPALARQLVTVSRILWIKQQLVRASLLTALGGGALIALAAATG